jgi:hypothetical protein
MHKLKVVVKVLAAGLLVITAIARVRQIQQIKRQQNFTFNFNWNINKDGKRLS